MIVETKRTSGGEGRSSEEVHMCHKQAHERSEGENINKWVVCQSKEVAYAGIKELSMTLMSSKYQKRNLATLFCGSKFRLKELRI